MDGIGGKGRRASALLVALALLTACSSSGSEGGGGSGGTGGGPYFPAAAEPAAPFSADDWTASAEYQNSVGLAQINAAEGYARRTAGLPGGQGVRVAVIDSGIDRSHPDLGNLAPTSFSVGGEALAAETHATFVAGIIGATRSQTGQAGDMHGVAYRATLVNLQAARPSSGDVASFDLADVAAAIRAAAGAAGAPTGFASDILNLSLGGSSDSGGVMLDALRAAADSNRIMVIALGNQAGGGPLLPAALVADPDIAGLAIAVGNATADGDAASGSSLCGADIQEYCLFAPGSSIRSTIPSGYGIGSGTSFAAPHVAGAAAVVKAAFPGISNRDVVDRLLATARDLGDPEVFGRGLLDLEAAMAPVGELGLAATGRVADPRPTLAASTLALGSAFALDPSGRALLGRAIALDAMGFPFPVDLAGRVRIERRGLGLDAMLAPGLPTLAASDPAAGVTLSFAAAVLDDSAPAGYGLALGLAAEPAPPAHLQAALGEHLELFLSLNGSSATTAGPAALPGPGHGFVAAEALLAPFDRIAGLQSGGGGRLALGPATALTVSAFTAADHGEPAAALQKVELSHRPFGRLDLRLGHGWLQEEAGLLGSRSAGAFGGSTAGAAQFLHAAALVPLSERIRLLGSYSFGSGRLGGAGAGLLSRLEVEHAEAFALGLLIDDLAAAGDRLDLLLGQPLRAGAARARIALPVGRTPGGAVRHERQALDLSPPGRELAAQAVYRLPLAGPGRSLTIGGLLRLAPGHDPGAPPELGLGLRLAQRW